VDADLAFRPSIERFGLMEFSALDPIIECGYEHGREQLAAWRATGRLAALLGEAYAPGPALPPPTDADAGAETAVAAGPVG